MILRGDCLDVMPTMAENSVDAIVTDPPYALTANKKGGSGAASVELNSPYGRARIGAGNGGFMGKEWDGKLPGPEIWAAALRVAKPGAYLVAFGGTRTHHRLMVAIEDAGWEIRDCLMWLYGSGFPKSLDVSKAIDKLAGAKRTVIGHRTDGAGSVGYEAKDRGHVKPAGPLATHFDVTAPATDAAQQWDGWGTALKPAWEPIILARKPLAGTVAQNVLTHGVGGLNIDGCRIGSGADKIGGGCAGVTALHEGGITKRTPVDYTTGRWPANLLLDEDSAAVLDAQTGVRGGGGFSVGASRLPRHGRAQYGDMAQSHMGVDNYGDSGGASRFFYCAKASKKDRGEGNVHPTVKPTDLMRWLVRLVCPPGGMVLDPFAGSGTTGLACLDEGCEFTGIEITPEYADIADQRLGITPEPAPAPAPAVADLSCEDILDTLLLEVG